MESVRKRLTYANVMSSIAVFLVLGGATAFAATKIGSNEIKANAIVTGKIKKEAVTEGKIKAGAVGNSRLGNGSVTSNKLAANSVLNSAIADNSVGGSKIANGAVTEGKLANGAVTEGKLANGAVTEGKIANDAVTGAKVKDGSLTGSDIQQGTLDQVKAANVYAVEFDVSAEKVVRPSSPGIISGGCFFACFVEFPVNLQNCSATGAGVDATGSGTAIPGIIEVIHATNPKEIEVTMWNDEGNLIGHDFSLTVVCPTTS
jgi:hypothetical protein